MNKLIFFFGLILFLPACRKKDLAPVDPVPVIRQLTVSADSIVLNPTGYVPLSALVKYRDSMAGRTKIIVVGKNGQHSNVEHVFNDQGLSHSVPVIGLYPNYNNTVRILLIDQNGEILAQDSINIQTGPLPQGMPASISADIADHSNMEPGLNLVSSFSSEHPRIPYMLDSYGDVRWVLDYSNHPELDSLSYDNGLSRLRNGNFFFGDYGSAGVSSNKIYEIDVFGTVINSWHLSGYAFHHDVIEMPNGNFLLSATLLSSRHTDGSPTIEDYIIEVDRQTSSLVRSWDLKESLDEYRTALTDQKEDWMHVNSVYFDSTDNTIIVSGRTQGVFKLDNNNRVKWILSPHKGWGLNRRGEDLRQFLLRPLAADGSEITDSLVLNGNVNHPDFEWNWYQHSPIRIPNGNLLLFDNGDSRNYDDTSAHHYSRAVEYRIDETNMTVQQMWQYGKERGLETFSNIVSSVQFLPGTNHVLFAAGYHVENLTGRGGKVVEVDYATRTAVFQLSISSPNDWGFTRVKRITAYP